MLCTVHDYTSPTLRYVAPAKLFCTTNIIIESLRYCKSTKKGPINFSLAWACKYKLSLLLLFVLEELSSYNYYPNFLLFFQKFSSDYIILSTLPQGNADDEIIYQIKAYVQVIGKFLLHQSSQFLQFN